MTFFSRPELSNVQFKQLTGSTLTLSGLTQIATVSGLTLTDGAGGYIPIIATDAINNYVLTYDGVDNVIKLKESTASGGTGTYPYSGLTTCTVGGLSASTSIYNCKVVDILEEILVPTKYPNLTNPSISSFSISPSDIIYEVGSTPSITGTTIFDAGCINPQYSSACDCRSCGTQCYVYTVQGISFECIEDSTDNTYPFGSISINTGNTNFISARVCYCEGEQPYDSSGNTFSNPLAASATSVCQISIYGVLPWYWGIESSNDAASGVNRPSTTYIKSLITGGTANKCVNFSNGSLFVDYDSSYDDYIWFAIPNGSTSKICWYINTSNNGDIGGAVSAGGNLFPNPTLVSGISSSSPSWGGQTYKIYISNYQTEIISGTTIQLRNS